MKNDSIPYYHDSITYYHNQSIDLVEPGGRVYLCI